jgi:hypothetical protein
MERVVRDYVVKVVPNAKIIRVEQRLRFGSIPQS